MRETNYIQHLNTFFINVFEDDRFSPTHVALYMSLFQFWNRHRFTSPFSIARTDLMMLSKIKSKTTYSKCLRDLEKWNYISYQRSNNPLAKSKFSLTNIWSPDWPKSLQTHDSTSPVNGLPVNDASPNNGLPLDDTSPTNGPPMVPLYKTSKRKHINVDTPPDQKLVISFFLDLKSSKQEALKFWNHYESTDWKTGNTKIKNWKAAAKKWLIRNNQKNGSGVVHKMDHLHTTKNKDYGKPL